MRFNMRSARLYLPLALMAGAVGCDRPGTGGAAAGSAPDDATALEAVPAIDLEIRASEYMFALPTDVPSGWVTYRMNNQSASEIHEVSLGRLPEGRTHDDYVREVIPVWADVAADVDAGQIDGSEAYAVAGESLPGWAADIEYVRARGLVSPGRSTLNTLRLEPGLYTVDCWVRSPSGQLHLAVGMSRPLTVTEAASDVPPPGHDVTIRITAEDITAEPALTAGTRTIGLAADSEMDNVHLVRLASGVTPDSVLRWMDWGVPAGLQAPAPGEFLGGINRYGNPDPEGRASFTALDIEPGRYAWIVEMPGFDPPGLWREFVVR